VFSLQELEDTSFLSASGDGTIKKWDMVTGINTTTWNAHRNRILALTVMKDQGSKMIISAGADRDIKIWDNRTPKCIHTFEGHDTEVTSLALLGRNNEFASGSQDKTVKVLKSLCIYLSRSGT
jgi:guanine nucleotide-binding protein G(I)/G(S)/G(T) subunit beta-1